MARDRKRAKRRGRRGGGSPAIGTAPPSPVAHASGEVDEFDAAIARGAADASAPAGPPAAVGGGAGEFESALASGSLEEEEADGADGEGNGDLGVATLGEPGGAQEEEDEDVANGAGNGGTIDGGTLTAEAPERGRPSRGRSERKERQSIFARAVAFLRASWAELQRMQWPDRRQTSQATAVVLGFVVVAGIYLGVADWVAQKIVNFIL